MKSTEPAHLRRVVSRWEIVAVALNDVIGSGVYLLPAVAAAYLGAASLWAVLLAGSAVLMIVLCIAEASSYFDEPGGAYLYTRTAFGDLVGFEVGWMTWVARISSLASLSVGFALALSFLWPGAATGWGRAAAITLPVLAMTVLNVIGVKAGVRASVTLVIAKVVPLLIFLAAGLGAVRWATIRTQPITEEGGFAGAALMLMFAYAGFENSPAPAGEYRRPQRDIPFAMLTQITLVTLLYVAVQYVALGTLPDLGSSRTPLADAAQGFLGSWAGWLLTIGGAISILGTNSNTVLAGPRYVFAMARDGYGPRALAKVHPRFRTPAVAVVVQTAIALPLALSGTFVGLAALSVVARMATYIGTAAAVPVLRRKMSPVRPGFRLPGGALIPAAACLVALFLASRAGSDNLIAAGIALVVGGGLFLMRRKPPRTR